jgi:hypothetical protein
VFARGSRYEEVPDRVHELPGGRQATYKALRIIPAPSTVFDLHIVRSGDRLDLLADRYLGDPEAFWRICDENAAVRPAELVDRMRRRLRIPRGLR